MRTLRAKSYKNTGRCLPSPFLLYNLAIMAKTTKLLIFSSLAILITGSAIGAYFFFFKAPAQTERWRNAAGQLHRDNDLPAPIGYYENGEIAYENWYLDGLPHRENDQPAFKVYWESGEIEREKWYLNGELHREDNQPAVIVYDESGEIVSEEWHLDGELIKENPASM